MLFFLVLGDARRGCISQTGCLLVGVRTDFFLQGLRVWANTAWLQENEFKS
jgi:hypothetical protein